MANLFFLNQTLSGFSAMTGEHVALSQLNQDLKKEFSFLLCLIFFANFSIHFINEPGVELYICTGEGEQVICRVYFYGWKTMMTKRQPHLSFKNFKLFILFNSSFFNNRTFLRSSDAGYRGSL